jgi:penicillin-binding protein 2
VRVPSTRTADRRERLRVARALVVGLVLLLLGALFRMQVLRHSAYALQAEGNRLRAVPIPAPRGTVYDRHGRLLADNVPGYRVLVLPASVDTLRVALAALAPTLGLDSAAVASVVQKYRRYPGRPVLVAGDASFAQVSAIEERRAELPGGILVEAGPKRRYPAGPVSAHVVGYVAEISDAELESREFAGVAPGAIVGKMGVEREYDRWLRGEPGVRYVEANALGRFVGEFRGRPPTPPVPGRDLTLTLDLELQRAVADAFPDTMRGAVVALDPRTGDVLAMYSHPTFDPNAFVGGIDPALWSAWNEDPARPLFNRAIAGTYAPGSTFKLAVAAIAMAGGDVAAGTTMPIPCRGALLYYSRVFRCWQPEGHGTLDLLGAIKHSCDVYFYQLGLRVGLERLVRGVLGFGFAERTGIDLPSEAAGIFPLGPEWYDRRYGRGGWTNAVVLNLAIGQGENAQTMLKLAQFFSALATEGGRMPRPRITPLRPVEWVGPPLPLTEAQRRQLVEGMVRVVNDTGGTARGARLERWVLAGKTGTAQNPHGDDHALFVGFAPADAPEILVAAVVEFGRSGARTAAPVVSRVIRFYLEREHPEALAAGGERGTRRAPSAAGGGLAAGRPTRPLSAVRGDSTPGARASDADGDSGTGPPREGGALR